jgi:hypothetical protein
VKEMMDLHPWKQRREEMVREVRRNRLTKALRDSRKRPGVVGTSSLAPELKMGPTSEETISAVTARSTIPCLRLIAQIEEPGLLTK